MEEPEGSFIRFDDDDEIEVSLVKDFHDGGNPYWDNWDAGAVYHKNGYQNIENPAGGYVLQGNTYYRGYRKRVKMRDGRFLFEVCALTKEDVERRDLRDEKRSIAFKENAKLSPPARKLLNRIHTNRAKKNPAADIGAETEEELVALDEALAAWGRITEAWNLITPTCETQGCPNPAKHHSVPKTRPKIPRESCDKCNQYFRNHGIWPDKER
jgi:hypothetical protein